MTEPTRSTQHTVSPGRALAWLTALLLTAGASLVVARYAFGDSGWGGDAVWAILGAIIWTRTIYDKLIEMWRRT